MAAIRGMRAKFLGGSESVSDGFIWFTVAIFRRTGFSWVGLAGLADELSGWEARFL